MSIFPLALPAAAAARMEGKPVSGEVARSVAGDQTASFADHARRLDDAGTAGRHASEGEDSGAASDPRRDFPEPDPHAETAIAQEEEEFAAVSRADLVAAGTTRNGEGETPERGAPRAGDGRMSPAVVAATPGRDALFTVAPIGTAPDDAATETVKRAAANDDTRITKTDAAGMPTRDAQPERPAAATITATGSAHAMAMGGRTGRPDTAAAPRALAQPPQPRSEQREMSAGRAGLASDAVTASRMRILSAADAAPQAPTVLQTTPAMSPPNPAGDHAHRPQGVSARILSALSALPAGESGAPSMIIGGDNLAPTRGLNAPLDTGPGHAQETGRAAGRALVDQILPVLQRSNGGRVELTLAPAELGRLEITFQSRDGGMSVSLNAERPETLELLRRHIDLLAADMRQLGMTDLSFSFGRESAGGSAPEENERRSSSNDGAMAQPGDRIAASAVNAASPQHQSSESARMDLRL